jgi:hypothetical protein
LFDDWHLGRFSWCCAGATFADFTRSAGDYSTGDGSIQALAPAPQPAELMGHEVHECQRIEHEYSYKFVKIRVIRDKVALLPCDYA